MVMVTLLNAFTACMGVMFFSYVFFILFPFLRHRKLTPGDPAAFSFHLFIPCRDEEMVIATTIERARCYFPDAHVWVIDDDSDDNTVTIASRYAADPFVHIVRRRRPEARTGKGHALNAAYMELNNWLPAQIDRENTIVSVIDADGEMAGNALHVVSSKEVFGNPNIGAAQIAVWMKNREDKVPYPGRGRLSNMRARWIIRMQDIEFRTGSAAMQALRARAGTVGLGGNGQFTRLSVLDAISLQQGRPWNGALLEDYELGLQVLFTGSKIKHVYDTHVSQEAVPSIRRLLTQRTRWAQGNIQCVRYIPQIVRSQHFSSAGVVETCYYLVLPFLQMLGMMAFLTLAGIGILETITNPGLSFPLLEKIEFDVLLSLLFAIMPFILWGPVYKIRCEPKTSVVRSILYGFGVWIYIYYIYICIPRAFLRIMLRRNSWSKTRRNAEPHIID